MELGNGLSGCKRCVVFGWRLCSCEGGEWTEWECGCVQSHMRH